MSEVFSKRFRAYAEGSCVRVAPIWDSCGRHEMPIYVSSPEEVEEVVKELREVMLKALRQARRLPEDYMPGLAPGTADSNHWATYDC